MHCCANEQMLKSSAQCASASRRHAMRAAIGVGMASCLPGLNSSKPAVAMSRLTSSQSQHIQITAARLHRQESQWLFDCSAQIELPSDIQLGLENGVPLEFIVALRVTSPRKFWRDRVLLAAEHRYRLVYYELTRHYRVQSIDSGSSLNKRSLLSALDELGTVRMMDVTDNVQDAEALLDTQLQRQASVSIWLDGQALPLPLQPWFSSRYYGWLLLANGLGLAFIGTLIVLNGWRLVSEWLPG